MALFDDLIPSGDSAGGDSTLFGDLVPERTIGGQVKEAVKGIIPGAVKFGGTTLKGAAGLQKGAQHNAAAFGRGQIDVMDRIDRGESVPEIDDAMGYQHMSPEQRKEARAELEQAQKDFAPGKVEDSVLYQAGESVRKTGEKILPAAPGYDDSLGRSIGEGLGSVAGGVVASAVAGPVAGGALFTLSGSGESVERAVAGGASEEDIIQAAKTGQIPGMTDSLPVETLLGRVPIPGGKFIKIPAGLLGDALKVGGRIGFQALIEGIQEGGQEFLQNAIEQTYNPNQTLMENVPESAAMGAAVGGIAGGVMAPFHGGAEGPSETGSAGSNLFGDLAAKPAAEAPKITAAPEAPVDRERLDSPRLTAEDRASPIPNDLIDDGKAIIEAATTGPKVEEQSATVATPETTIIPPSQRAILRKAGSTDDEIDAMSVEERQADVSEALQSGIEPSLQDVAGAQQYKAAAAPASVEPLAAVTQPETAVAAPAPSVAEPQASTITSQSIDPLAHEAATSPANDLPEPSQAQIEAGNYRKGHVKLAGLDISIENPKGSTRSGTDPDGNAWEVTLPAHYGYITGVVARSPDKEHVDVYVGDAPQSDRAFIINQVDPKTGKFDEAKIVLGAKDSASAITIYDQAFSDGSGPQRRSSAIEMPVADLKEYLNTHGFKLPLRPSASAGRIAVEMPSARPEGDARDVSTSSVQRLAKRAGQMSQPEESVLPQLRREGDNDSAGVDGLPGVPESGGRSPDAGAPTGPEGQRSPLRAGKPALGDETRAGAEPAQEPSVDDRRGNAADGRVGENRGAGSVDDTLPAVTQDDAEGSRVHAAANGERDVPATEPEPQHALKQKREAQASKPMRSDGQKEPGGLFSDDSKQTDLIDMARQNPAFRLRETSASGVTTEFVLTDDFADKAEDLTKRLRKELDSLGLNDIGLRVSESISAIVNGERFAADGRFFRNVIDVALDTSDASATLNHEAVHALRKLGLFSKSEWSILSRKSESSWIDHYDIADTYGDIPAAALIEEGIAHAYADWASGTKTDGIIARSFKRIKGFIEALRNSLNGLGFKSADSIFRKLGKGEVGARARNNGSNGANSQVGTKQDLPRQRAADVAKQDDSVKFSISSDQLDRWQKHLALLVKGEAKLDAFVVLKESPVLAAMNGGKGRVVLNTRRFGQIAKDHPDIPADTWKQLPELLVDPLFAFPHGADRHAVVLVARTRAGSNIIVGVRSDGEITTITPWDGSSSETSDERVARALATALTRPGKVYTVTKKALDENLRLTRSNPADLPSSRSGMSHQGRKAKIVTREDIVKKIDEEPKFSLVERGSLVDTQDIPRVRAVTSPLSKRIMSAIKRGKDDPESLGDYSHRKLVDYLHPIRTMIESVGGTVQDTMNAYLQARLAEDSAIARIQGVHDAYVTPAVEALAKTGASLDDLHRYLYARHAPERNRVVGLRNEEGSDLHKAVTDHSIKGASGWSTDEAKRTIRELQANPEKFAGIQEAARLMRAMIDSSLLDQKKAGLISDETYKLLTEQWQHYVPLRAEDGTDENGNFKPGGGRGFDVRGKEFKAATGRSTEAENIPAWAVSLSERTQLRAEKNTVGKAMLRFINHFDPKGESLAKVYWSDDVGFGDIEKAPPVYQREIGKDGKVTNRTVPPSTIAPDMFAVKVGGKAYYIKFADEKVGLALKKMGVVDLDAMSRLARKWTGFQSLVNTRANPAFVPVNIIRDAATGGIHLLDEGFSAGEATKILGSIPNAWGALWRNARGKPGKNEWDAALKEYIAAGGKIAFEPHKTLEDSINELRTKMTEAVDGKAKWKSIWDTFVKFLGDLNDSGENGMRLAAYVAARAQGRTVKQAAFLGRDLTVDFKKHGEVGPLLNSWFVFFNASVQGNYNIAVRLAKSKQVRRAAFAIAASGVLADLLNRSLSGDDDDGESFYEKMLRNEPWKFERSMVIFYGGDKGDYFTIPLPYGYNAIYNLGVQAAGAAHGNIKPLDAIASTARVTFDAFNPIGGGGSWLNMFVPTILDPAVEVATNQSFTGAPITPTKFPGDNSPDSQRFFQSTPDWARTVADWMNTATGGNAIEPGMVDIAPDVYEHLWGYVSGGIGRFFGQAFDTGSKVVTGKSDEIEPQNVPWVRSFMGRVNDDTRRSEYYKQREEVQTAKDRLHDYKDSGDQEAMQEFIERNRTAVSSIKVFDAAEKNLKKIRKAKRSIDLDKEMSRSEKDEKLKPLKDAEMKIMNGVRLVYARNRTRNEP